MAVKTFTTGSVLTAADTNTYLANAGLVYISQTTFSGATSVSVSNAFSATYDRYVVLADITGSNIGGYAYVRFKTGSTEYSVAEYYKYGYYCKYSTGLSQYIAGGETFVAPLAVFNGLANETRWEIQNPYSSSYRTSGFINCNDVADGSAYNVNHVVATTTSFDGFNIYPVAGVGTLTGKVTIYGVRKP